MYLFTIFLRASGLVHISCYDKGKTIDHQTCIKASYSHEGKKEFRRPELYIDGPFILLAGPCDFWLFSYIKERLDPTCSESQKFKSKS